MDQVWFITGAGRGFGRAFAEEAVKRGDRVIAGLRHLPDGDPFFRQEAVLPLHLDVTDPETIRGAVEEGLAHFGRIDVLINNAGFGLSGAFEETSDSDLLFDLDQAAAFGITIPESYLAQANLIYKDGKLTEK